MKNKKSINEQLRLAVRSGSTEEIKRCLRVVDCDPLVRDHDGWSALMLAARYGYGEGIRLLLPRSDALEKTIEGWSALMMASRFGYQDCVKLLLPHSDAWCKNKNGDTALTLAAMGGCEECVNILLPHSDPWVLDSCGQSASQIATQQGRPDLARMIDAHIAQREAEILTGHVSSGPQQGQARGKSTPRL